jgi:Leucine-rich repeat (LRR) protein
LGLVVVFVVTVSSMIKAEDTDLSVAIECEYIEDISWDEWTRMGNLRCCFMQNDIEISSRNSKISNVDETVTALDFSHNKKISILPVEINDSFENLKALAALECAIGEISEDNFRGLNKLKFLDLTENLIETIPNKTFDDLESLEFLALGDNKIHLMNGEIFVNLKNLRKVLIVNNPCINEVFSGECSIEQLPTIINRKCGEMKGNFLTCSRVSNSTWSDWTEMGERRDCELDEKVSIDSKDFTFLEHDDSVTGLDFSFNTKISYLPIKVNENFKSLQAYAAPGCLIEELFKENFESLSILVVLDLKGNKIQVITTTVFEDLENLKVLRLSYNKIKFMNGEIFAPLKNLQSLHLEENRCINRNYIEESLSEAVSDINENCGYFSRNEIIKPDEMKTDDILFKEILELKKSVDEIKAILMKNNDNL